MAQTQNDTHKISNLPAAAGWTDRYRATVGGLVCSPVQEGTLFALTQDFHFYALLLHTFLFKCTLHWCDHCTGPKVAPNLRKFPMTALYRAAVGGLVCRPTKVGAVFLSLV